MIAYSSKLWLADADVVEVTVNSMASSTIVILLCSLKIFWMILYIITPHSYYILWLNELTVEEQLTLLQQEL